MILDRYIFKELLKTQILVLMILIVVFAGQSFIRLISQAAIGSLPPSLIFKFLYLSLPEFLIFLLPLTLYISIILTLGRICSDSEMVVMRSIRYSPLRIMTITLILAGLTAIASAYIGGVLTYKSAQERERLELEASQNPEFLPIDSGRFVSFGSYNIYVEEVQNQGDKEKRIQNIYVIDTESKDVSITVAYQGRVDLDEDGVRWLVLKDGRRYENQSDGTFRYASFSEFKAPIYGNVNDESKEKRKVTLLSTQELLMSSGKNEQMEVQWRLSAVFAVLVLSMIAVPLSMVNPRQGRFARLMPAIVIYVAYYMFVLSARNLVNTNVLAIYPGLYSIPLAFLVLVAIPLNLPKTYLKKIKDRKTVKKALLAKKQINSVLANKVSKSKQDNDKQK